MGTDNVNSNETTSVVSGDAGSLLARAVASAPFMLIALDADGLITLSEGRAASEVGLASASVKGHSIFEVCADKPEVLAGVRRALDGESTDTRVAFGPQTFEAFFQPLFDENGERVGAIAVATDITRSQLREGEMSRLAKLESLGLLAGGIAHDFNNTLSTILMNVGLAKADPVVGASPARVRLDAVETECDIARGLTRQLMTYAKAGDNHRCRVEVSKAVGDAIAFALGGTDTTWEAHFEPGLWDLDTDEAQVRQALGSVALNGSQAMQGGGTLVIRAENCEIGDEELESGIALRAGRYVKLIIEDRGCGIESGALEKVFDPYYSTRAGSAGLGLATAHSAVVANGGKIAIASEPGRGTTVVLYLPASADDPSVIGSDPGQDDGSSSDSGAHDSADSEAAREAAADEAIGQGGGTRILVMDDEPGVRDVLRLALGSAGYEIDLARDGDEVVDLYKAALAENSPYSVVIMDLEVKGGRGGLDALSSILEVDPSAKVIVSSGYTRDPAVSDFASFGFVGALAKPYTVSELRRAIADATP